MKIITELTLAELTAELKAMGEPSFRAKQIHEWIYRKNAASWDDMTNLSKELRQQCSEKWLFNSVQMAESVKSQLRWEISIIPDCSTVI